MISYSRLLPSAQARASTYVAAAGCTNETSTTVLCILESQQDVPYWPWSVLNCSGLRALQQTKNLIQGCSNFCLDSNATPNPFEKFVAQRHCATQGLACHCMAGFTRLQVPPEPALDSLGVCWRVCQTKPVPYRTHKLWHDEKVETIKMKSKQKKHKLYQKEFGKKR